MKKHLWILAVLLAFTAGWFTGRGRPGVACAAEPVAAGRSMRPQASAAHETSRKRWAEKLGEQDGATMPALIGDIPANDRGAAIEAWLRSCGIGGLDGAAIGRLRDLLDAWVATDFEGAWQWAGNLADPGLRELAMTGIAGSLCGSDPHRAFDCLVAHGEFHREIDDSRIYGLMKTLSKEAAKQGPMAIAELWEKLPKAAGSIHSFYGIDIELDPSTDFRALNDALRSKLDKQLDRPIHPCNAMEAWMRQDPDAATGYLVEQIAAKTKIADAWSELRGAIARDKGSAAADQWTIDLLRSLPEGDPGTLLNGVGYPNSPELFFNLLQGASEAEAAAWISETIQSSADKGLGGEQIARLLGVLPVEKRIDYLRTLHGPQALESAEAAMATWGLPESQREEVRKAVSGP